MVKQIEYLDPKKLPFILRIIKGPYNQHIQRYLFAKKFVEGAKVLDVACGVGYGSYELATLADSVVGFEKNGEAIEVARTEYFATNIEYIQGDATKLPFETESFDCIVCFETLEHLPMQEMGLFLQELSRVLKHGGKLLLSSPDKNGLSLGYASSNPYHTREFSHDELKNLVSPYLQIVKYYGQEFTDARLVSFFAKLFKFLPDEISQRVWRFVRVLFGCTGEVVENSGDHQVPLYIIVECRKL